MKTILFRIFMIVFAISSVLPVQQASAWGRFDGGHHPAYGGAWAHRSPVIVHRTYIEHRGGGCVGCGLGVAAVAGLVGGAIIGAAIAQPSAPPPQTVIVQNGPPMGAQLAALPPGCASMNVNGGQYYQCGGYWYQPFFGGNGVYYTAVPAP